MANRRTEIGRILRAGDVGLARVKVRRVLYKTGGNVWAAARVIGVSDDTVWRWIRRFALEEHLQIARERTASTRVDG